MNNELKKIPYEQLKIEGLKEVLQEVSAACQVLKIDFFIVGAIARNIWYVAHGEAPKDTKDIDFGVYIPDTSKYIALKSKLQQDYSYRNCPNNAFCMFTPNSQQIDLLPFGAIEKENQVIIAGKGLITINLEGFQEVFNFGLQTIQLGNEQYTISNIPSIVLLKLIAFDDRPEYRIKDVKDINTICRYYPNLEDTFIWEKHSDLYNEVLSHQDVAMRVLGREMRKVAKTNLALHTRVVQILTKAIDLTSNLTKHMIQDSETDTLEQKSKLLANILNGFTEVG